RPSDRRIGSAHPGHAARRAREARPSPRHRSAVHRRRRSDRDGRGTTHIEAAMSAPIDFYFDFSSPYGYLASTRIDAIAARHGRSVDWHPILLGAVFKATGGAPLASIPLKGPYSERDMARSARLMEVPFRLPSRFPI